jgi:hypothetical protein
MPAEAWLMKLHACLMHRILTVLGKHVARVRCSSSACWKQHCIGSPASYAYRDRHASMELPQLPEMKADAMPH